MIVPNPEPESARVFYRRSSAFIECARRSLADLVRRGARQEDRDKAETGISEWFCVST